MEPAGTLPHPMKPNGAKLFWLRCGALSIPMGSNYFAGPPYGILRNLMEPCGTLSTLTGLHGALWNPIEYRWNLMKPVKPYGSPTEPYGALWGQHGAKLLQTPWGTLARSKKIDAT